MMTEILLITAYVLPLALLAVVLSRLETRPRWLLPLLLTTLPVFYTAHYLFIEGQQGWPTMRQPPDDFELIAFRVEEPEPTGSETGSILLWLVQDGKQIPRVHRLPYDRALHEELDEAGKRLAVGTPQYGNTAPAKEAADGSALATPHIRFTTRSPLTLPAKSEIVD
jgi:hypothetical protein